jgi:hypothetical protein
VTGRLPNRKRRKLKTEKRGIHVLDAVAPVPNTSEKPGWLTEVTPDVTANDLPRDVRCSIK